MILIKLNIFFHQPLDVCFFSSLKAELKSLIWNWQCDKLNAGQALNKYTVVVLLHQATENCLAKDGIVSKGFIHSGLYPWNPSAPDVSKLLPGTIFAVQSEESNSTPNAGDTTIMDTISDISISPQSSSAGGSGSPPPVEATILTHEISSSAQSSSADGSNSTPAIVNITMASNADKSTSAQCSTDGVCGLTPSAWDMNSNHEIHSADHHDATPSGTLDTSACSDQANCSYSLGDLGFLEDSPDHTQSLGEPLDIDAQMVPCENSPVVQSTTPNNVVVASKKCPKCSKGIPETVLHIHISLCTSESTPTPLPPPKLTTIPNLSLKERQRELAKFEMLMLSEESVLEFNNTFKERNISHEEPMFKAWLVLKNASLPTEAQVLQQVIEDHTATNVPKKKTTRKRNLPEGPARYDPSSPEWETILKEQASKKKKVTQPKPKPKPTPKEIPQKVSKKNPSGGKKSKPANRKLIM